jgi:hypothetical protein
LYVLVGVGIIAAQTRMNQQTWRCDLVAAESAWERMLSQRLVTSDRELAALATTVRSDPGDAETYALLWQTRIRQRWPGGHTPALARVIAEHLRIPATLSADLDLSAVLHLMRQTGCRPQGVTRILSRLGGAGYLTHLQVPDEQASAWVVLTLPAAQPPSPPDSTGLDTPDTVLDKLT